jgi:hypothetical protein
MRRITALATGLFAIAAIHSTAAAQSDTTKAKEAVPSIEGAWTGYLTMGSGGQTVNATIAKAKDADGYTGTVSGLNGDVALQKIALKGDTLTAMAVMSTGGANFEVWYWFKVTKDALTGSLDANVQGQAVSLPLTLTRPK